MKKILLLSDTHSHIDEQILKHVRDADEIWHAGDWGIMDVSDAISSIKPVRGVYGNIDGDLVRRVYPEYARFKCGNVDVLMTHQGGYPGKYHPLVRKIFEANPPDLFITGHSHILKVMRDKNINNLLHINPGAAGIHGFHRERTMVRFKIDGSRIFDLEIINLGLRVKS